MTYSLSNELEIKIVKFAIHKPLANTTKLIAIISPQSYLLVSDEDIQQPKLYHLERKYFEQRLSAE
jgi:hypothetical protein